MCLQLKCLIYAQAFCPVLIFTWLEETKQKTLAIKPHQLVRLVVFLLVMLGSVPCVLWSPEEM